MSAITITSNFQFSFWFFQGCVCLSLFGRLEDKLFLRNFLSFFLITIFSPLVSTSLALPGFQLLSFNGRFLLFLSYPIVVCRYCSALLLLLLLFNFCCCVIYLFCSFQFGFALFAIFFLRFLVFLTIFTCLDYFYAELLITILSSQLQ